MNRELHKAYVAFYQGRNRKHEADVATGNWGCGAFNGDPQFKLLIQWLAASEAERPSIVYYTLNDHKFSSEIEGMEKLLRGKHVSVSKLYRILERYGSSHSRGSVFDYVRKNL